MILASTVELFVNLAQYDFDEKYYDFHNDYTCHKMLFLNDNLYIFLKTIKDEKSIVTLKFYEIEFTRILFFNTPDVSYLTIDNLYRGRIEVEGGLKEISESDKAYFYLEFYEGQTFEFWAKSIEIEDTAYADDMDFSLIQTAS